MVYGVDMLTVEYTQANIEPQASNNTCEMALAALFRPQVVRGRSSLHNAEEQIGAYADCNQDVLQHWYICIKVYIYIYIERERVGTGEAGGC